MDNIFSDIITFIFYKNVFFFMLKNILKELDYFILTIINSNLIGKDTTLAEVIRCSFLLWGSAYCQLVLYAYIVYTIYIAIQHTHTHTHTHTPSQTNYFTYLQQLKKGILFGFIHWNLKSYLSHKLYLFCTHLFSDDS